MELQIDAWDRHRLLEDLSRAFAETGINILEARCTVVHPMVKNRFVVEVGDTTAAEDLRHAAPEHRRRFRRVPHHADDLGGPNQLVSASGRLASAGAPTQAT